MKKVVKKTTLNSQPSDLAYCLAQPVEARFAALETLRQQVMSCTSVDTPKFSQSRGAQRYAIIAASK